eukprot:CAMPEP_0182577580 /NCGR_PEP_ID=MMETSP1324-20130603/38231_1 /TAXON_ID=236786 /ORGANISM="Florenciella sp., Strain RCC1587" /LENGTH=165 /DNA_ID=CAMNT_0024793421 /DNA_START=80 /DNA_END=574 /DNA_ORIENTATION=+
MCNQAFEKVESVPDALDEPKKWFKLVDLDGNGTLSQKEVVEVLKAQLPIDADDLEESFGQLWNSWDKDKCGELSYDELMSHNGLLSYLELAKDTRAAATAIADAEAARVEAERRNAEEAARKAAELEARRVAEEARRVAEEAAHAQALRDAEAKAAQLQREKEAA